MLLVPPNPGSHGSAINPDARSRRLDASGSRQLPAASSLTMPAQSN
jgi:hypothetical protein